MPGNSPGLLNRANRQYQEEAQYETTSLRARLRPRLWDINIRIIAVAIPNETYSCN